MPAIARPPPVTVMVDHGDDLGIPWAQSQVSVGGDDVRPGTQAIVE
jgi:hypothetical protein